MNFDIMKFYWHTYVWDFDKNLAPYLPMAETPIFA
jgi:hypothetical protein